MRKTDAGSDPPFHSFFVVILFFLMAGLLFQEGCGNEKPSDHQGPKIVVAIEGKAYSASGNLPSKVQAGSVGASTAVIEPPSSPVVKPGQEDSGPPSRQDEPPEPPPGRYLVRSGDTLAEISGRKEVYGDRSKWPILFRQNLDQLEDLNISSEVPDLPLPEGLALRFVPPEEASRNLQKTHSKSWVVNVMSDRDPTKVVVPTVALSKKGYRTYITRARIKGEDWVRLRVGFFESRSDARAESHRISRILGRGEAWIVKPGREELEEYAGYDGPSSDPPSPLEEAQ